MNLITANAVLSALLAGVSAVTAKDINTNFHTNVTRELSTMTMFKKLTCNTGLTVANCTEATALSSVLENTPAGEEPRIPCGTCVIVDTDDGSTVHLPNGLNVEGMLYIPSSAHVVFEATHIVIQGEWKIDPPDLGKTVTVRMVGTVEEFLHPHYENADACDTETGCKIGKKAIVVAGGKLDIRGLSDTTCPAFTKLKLYHKELTTDRPGCPANYDLLVGDGTFDTGKTGFEGHHGGHSAKMDILVEDDGNSYLSLSGRCCDFSGLRTKLDLTCAEQSVKYEFSIRYRAHSTSSDPQPNGNIGFQIQPQDGSSGCNSCRNIAPNCPKVVDDEWVTCTFTFTLKSNEMPPKALTANFAMTLGVHPSKTIDYDDISLRPLPEIRKLIVDSKAAQCWGTREKDEILITNTKSAGGWGDQLVRTIESVDVGSGTLFLPPTDPILSDPVTEEEEPDMASEVAWLSRPIVFDAVEDDGTSDERGPLHGGHLIVLHTPGVAQTLEGVEIKNFGQQGNLGRYPIHFHMSMAVTGSIVRKNVIRDSNQRCVVIHGSNEVLVEDNVAFDTYGHCYILEDGAEMENTFRGNLGARTRNQKIGIGSTDKQAATYWITNTKNHFIGNVAAGSMKNGFWFELLQSVRGDSGKLPDNINLNPNQLPLYTFRDNVAHSNSDGVRTYFPGWRCPTEAIFEGLKVYQNRIFGLFLHGTKNVKVRNGYFADNRIGILYFGNFGTNIVEESRFIGVPERFRGSHCSNRREGIRFSMELRRSQIEVHNTSFSGFSNIPSDCEKSGAGLNVQSIQAKSVYDMPVLSNLSFDANATYAVDITSPFLEHNIFIEDPSGTMNPSNYPGFYVNNIPQMTSFMEEACSPIPKDGSYALFCEGVCLRRVYVNTGCCAKENGTPDVDYKMVVRSVSDSTKTYTFEKKTVKSGLWTYNQKFDLVLPFDTYTVDFVSEKTGEIEYPEVTWSFGEAPQCADYVTEESFSGTAPSAAPSGDPSTSPSSKLSVGPSATLSGAPSLEPSSNPSSIPSVTHSEISTGTPTNSPPPTGDPSANPSARPSTIRSTKPSSVPSIALTLNPSAKPSSTPTATPSSEPSFTRSPVQTSSAPPSVRNICEGEKKNKCKKLNDFCIFGNAKIPGPCVPKKRKHKHDCAKYNDQAACFVDDNHGGLCKWDGVCSHICDDLSKKNCFKMKNDNGQKTCKAPKIANPCKGCHLKSTCA